MATTPPLVKMVEQILAKFFYRERSSTDAVFTVFEVTSEKLYTDLLRLFEPFNVVAVGQAGEPPVAPYRIRFETQDVNRTQYLTMLYMVTRVERSMRLGHKLIDYRIIGAECMAPAGLDKEQYSEKNIFYAQSFLKNPEVHRFVQEAERRRRGELAAAPSQ